MSDYPSPTKAEILLTRGCDLNCSYCAMRKYTAKTTDSLEWTKRDELTDKQWGKVPAKLVELGVPFAPIYGAEPLTRLPALKNFITYATKVKLPVTVITSGTLLTDNIITDLMSCGLDSITMSHDIIPADATVEIKTKKAEERLDYLLTRFDDVTVVVTIHKKNYKLLPEFVKRMDEKGVWVCMDLYHPDRGQPGCKCRGIDRTLVLDQKDITDFGIVMDIVRTMKREGYKIHPPDEYFDMLSTPQNIERYILNYGWKCRSGPWITLDANGDTMACDDFQPPEFKRRYPILEYGETWTWTQFVDDWRRQLKYCPGCFWSTHIASDIWWGKQGWMDNQTHGRVKE